jgi:serine protease AprX
MVTKKMVGHRMLSLFGAVVLVLTLLKPVPMMATGLRVIVQGDSAGAAAGAVVALGGVVESKIDLIDAVVANVTLEQIARLEDNPRIVRVVPDREVQLAHNAGSSAQAGGANVETSKVIGAKPVWESGILGDAITVAILDTGVDPRFPELRNGARGRGERFLAYYDAMTDKLYEPPFLLRSPGDPNGHGTHIAGIIANNHFETRDGEYRGVAPAANIVAVRVLNADGAGTYADVLHGIRWVIENKDTYNIRVLNISMYAAPIAPYWADPYNQIVMKAWEAGIVVVASAGNTGPGPMSIGVPGNTPYVITVGTFTDSRTPDDFGDDYIPQFSAAGPTLDAFVKPDVIAPGAHIVSLMHQTATIRRANPDRRVDGRYFEMSGSSMSTAVVSGISALMLSGDGDLTPDEVKYRVTQTARPQTAEAGGALTAAYSIWQQGAGRVWAADAVLSNISGAANQGMDVAGERLGHHYQGWTTYNATDGVFGIIGGGFDGRLDGYTTWNGSFDSWADGYADWADGATNWAGSFDSWADSFDSWADSFDSWADSFDSWADSFDSWADSFDSWADRCLDPAAKVGGRWQIPGGNFTTWKGSFDSWADSLDSWEKVVAWSGSFDSWADSFDSWADVAADPSADLLGCAAWQGSFDSWADSYRAWVASLDALSGGVATWTGAFEAWEGGYLTWASSFDSWADSFDSWADGYGYWATLCSVDDTSFDSWADSFDSWADFVEFVNLVNSFDSWADFVEFVNLADSFDSWADFLDFIAFADSFDSWADFVNYVNSFDSWADSFDSWADSFSTWEDLVAWVNSFDSWADSFDSWADSFDSWADFVAWLDSFDSWADSFDSWADSFDSWADFVGYANSFDSWADSFDSWADFAAHVGSFDSWADSFDSWADSFDSWADFVAWLDSFDSWADSFDSWADGFVARAEDTASPTRPAFCDGWIDSFDSWADSFDSWADSFDSWADGDPTLLTTSFEVWTDGYTRWIQGVGAEVGSFDSWADCYADPEWAERYRNADRIPGDAARVSINLWVDGD